MERETGFEPATSTLARSHSTTELFPLARTLTVPHARDALQPLAVSQESPLARSAAARSSCASVRASAGVNVADSEALRASRLGTTHRPGPVFAAAMVPAVAANCSPKRSVS